MLFIYPAEQRYMYYKNKSLQRYIQRIQQQKMENKKKKKDISREIERSRLEGREWKDRLTRRF